MPGSSVSSCHMCHMHSHNPEGLVRTNPLRTSRSKTKHHKSSSKHHHHNHNHNRGYSSEIDDLHGAVRRTHSNSSNLARLSEHSHSYGRNRSNSFSDYPTEVSIMPGGSSNLYRREMRHNSSHSLDGIDIQGTSMMDHRSSSLPRVSSSIQPPIVPQPDILVNTILPRSRSGSRGGTLTRTQPTSLTVDNPHDYYLQLHRQKFKEEKRKHVFNLQTVMLIGCYALLVMVAIVVGVVVCYQNGWLGLGPPQKRIAEKDNVSNSIRKTPLDIRNQRIKLNNDINKNKNLQNRPIDPGSQRKNNNFGVELNSNIRSDDNHRNVQVASIFPRGTGDVSGRGKDITSQTNQGNVNLGENTEAIHGGNHVLTLSPSNSRSPSLIHRRTQPQIPPQRTIEQEPHSRFPNLRGTSDDNNSQSPRHRPKSNPKVVDGLIQVESFSNPVVRTHPVQRQSNNPINTRHSIPILTQNQNNLRDQILIQHNQQRPLHSTILKPIHSVANVPSLSSHVRSSNVRSSNVPASNVRSSNVPSSNIPSSNVRSSNVRSSNVRSSNIPSSNIPSSNIPSSNVRSSNVRSSNVRSSNILSSNIPSSNIPNLKTNKKEHSSLTTQDLIDLLAIRRLRDLLNSRGNKNILNLLGNIQPSGDMTLQAIKETKLNSPNVNNSQRDDGILRSNSGRNVNTNNGRTTNVNGGRNINVNSGRSANVNNGGSTNVNSGGSSNVNSGGSTNVNSGGSTDVNSGRLINVNKRPNNQIQPTKTLPVNQKALSNIPNTNRISSSSSINSMVNNTMRAAISRLINSRSKLNTNTGTIPAAAIVPHTQAPLVHFPITVRKRPNHSTVIDLEFLRNLISRNIALEKQLPQTAKNFQLSPNTAFSQAQPPSHVPENQRSQLFGPRQGISVPNANRAIEVSVANSSSPNNFGLINSQQKSKNRNNAKTSRGRKVQMPTPRKVTQAVSSTSELNEPLSFSIGQQAGPNPTFSVLVQTDLVHNSNIAKSFDTIHSSHSAASNQKQQSTLTSNTKLLDFLPKSTQVSNPPTPLVPRRELVIVRPGQNNAFNPDTIRSWTHMDSTGILSRGRVLSDGSFSFTNCSPIAACNANNKKKTTDPNAGS